VIPWQHAESIAAAGSHLGADLHGETSSEEGFEPLFTRHLGHPPTVSPPAASSKPKMVTRRRITASPWLSHGETRRGDCAAHIATPPELPGARVSLGRRAVVGHIVTGFDVRSSRTVIELSDKPGLGIDDLNDDCAAAPAHLASLDIWQRRPMNDDMSWTAPVL